MTLKNLIEKRNPGKTALKILKKELSLFPNIEKFVQVFKIEEIDPITLAYTIINEIRKTSVGYQIHYNEQNNQKKLNFIKRYFTNLENINEIKVIKSYHFTYIRARNKEITKKLWKLIKEAGKEDNKWKLLFKEMFDKHYNYHFDVISLANTLHIFYPEKFKALSKYDFAPIHNKNKNDLIIEDYLKNGIINNIKPKIEEYLSY